MFHGVMKNEQSCQALLKCSDPQCVFLETFKIKLKDEPDTAAVITDNVKTTLSKNLNGVKKVIYLKILYTVVTQVAFKMFNICSKNYKQELNDKIHASKKRERIGNPKQPLHIRNALKLSSH